METWWDDLATIEKSLFELPNYNSTHRARAIVKAVEFMCIYIYIYIHKSLDFIVKSILSININDIESFTIEIFLG